MLIHREMTVQIMRVTQIQRERTLETELRMRIQQIDSRMQAQRQVAAPKVPVRIIPALRATAPENPAAATSRTASRRSR